MRSRLFHLQAQRVFVRMAQSAHGIQAAQHQAQQAQAAQDRLAVLLDSLRPASGPVSVAQLRDTARLSHSLGAEQARQAELAQTASDQAHAARGELQHQLRRHQHAQQAARRAHREEAEAAQDRHDAAVPYRAR